MSAVLHLLSQPLAPLLCSERYKRYLQREQALVLIDAGLKFNASLLVGLPSVMSGLLNSRLGRTGPAVIAEEFVGKASWLFEDIPKDKAYPTNTFAIALIQALLESMRRHPNDEPDLHDPQRRANLVTTYQASPVEQLFVGYFVHTAHCMCGKLHELQVGTCLVNVDIDGRIQVPGYHRPFQTCEDCGLALEPSVELVQRPQFILVSNSSRDPNSCSVEMGGGVGCFVRLLRVHWSER